jgi:hypothetical protein
VLCREFLERLVLLTLRRFDAVNASGILVFEF